MIKYLLLKKYIYIYFHFILSLNNFETSVKTYGFLAFKDLSLEMISNKEVETSSVSISDQLLRNVTYFRILY